MTITLRTNIHPDKSQTFDVLLTDELDLVGIEISPPDRATADELLDVLARCGWGEPQEVINYY